MSYNRIKTPRAYTDLISQSLINGWRDLNDITIKQDDGSTSVTFNSGTEANLFDLKPANSVNIAKENQSFYIQFDTGLDTNSLAESNYLAILNHNFHNADAVLVVEISDNADMSSATKVSTTANHTKLINADANDTAGEIDPQQNGWTLITWSTQTSNNRYVRISISDDGGTAQNFATNVIIGSIMYGEYFDFPHSPDLNVNTSIDYDGTKLKKSLGGNSYATATNFGQPDWEKTIAWNNNSNTNTSNYVFNKRNGRIKHSMNFSFVNDTDMFSNNSASNNPTEWFNTLTIHNSFFNKIVGKHHPFLFSIDKDSTNESDYGIFRLLNNNFSATQSAPNIWDVKLDIEESW